MYLSIHNTILYTIIKKKKKKKDQFTMQLMLSSRIVIIFINSLVIDVMLLVDKLPRIVLSNKKKINTRAVVDPFFFFLREGKEYQL